MQNATIYDNETVLNSSNRKSIGECNIRNPVVEDNILGSPSAILLLFMQSETAFLLPIPLADTVSDCNTVSHSFGLFNCMFHSSTVYQILRLRSNLIISSIPDCNLCTLRPYRFSVHQISQTILWLRQVFSQTDPLPVVIGHTVFLLNALAGVALSQSRRQCHLL